MSETFDVIVIVGGPAGVTAALRARELGATVALVERSELGGTGTNDGCAPTRVLAKAARLMREAQHFDEYGLIGQEPTVDLELLLARVRQTIRSLHEKKQLLFHLQRAGIVAYTGVGQALFADESTVVLAGNVRLQAKKFILCAGGRARHLPIPGAEYALNHSDLWSLTVLPRSVVIIGGAATGCQLASILNAFGVEVWLLERGGGLLDKEDALTSEIMTRSFRHRGMRIHFTWILDLRDRRTGENLYPAFRHAFIDLPQDFEPLQGLLLDPCVNDPDNTHAILSAYLTEYAQCHPQFEVLR